MSFLKSNNFCHGGYYIGWGIGETQNKNKQKESNSIFLSHKLILNGISLQYHPLI
jgi:hypothetical protein